MDPQKLLDRADELRKEANETERMAIRAALESVGWYVDRAAAALGWHRSRLQRALRVTHPDLNREAEQQRRAGGWKGGRPVAPSVAIDGRP